MTKTESNELKLKVLRNRYNFTSYSLKRIRELKAELKVGKLKDREKYKDLMSKICMGISSNLFFDNDLFFDHFKFASEAAQYCKLAGVKIGYFELLKNARSTVRTWKFLNQMECIWEDADHKVLTELRDHEELMGIVDDENTDGEDDETSLV